ncbi:MAG: DUF3108 domain-containing protein [Sterolibacterium sp.]
MTSLRQQRLTLALLISLLLHLTVVVAPGWYLPTQDDELSSDSPPQLEAHLAPPRKTVAAAPPAAKPPRPKTPRRAAPPAAAMPVEPEATAANTPPAPVDAAPNAEPALPTEPPRPPDLAVQPEIAFPRRGSIRFAVSRGDQGFVIGQSLHRWSHDGKNYTLNSVTETTGLAAVFRPVKVMQSSEGEIGAQGLRPGKFHTGKNGAAGDAASFDWTTMTLSLSAGDAREAALKPGAQDMLSMFYQISAAFPRMTREASEVMVATGRKFERYAFETVREEMLSTRQGEWRTLHLHSSAGIESIDIWAALDLRGLPLKIRYTDRQGESFVQIAEEIDFEGMPSPAGGR